MKSKLFISAFYAFLIFTSSFNNCLSQTEATAGFLLFKPGGKANAMGGANVARASDFWGTYYNPGAIGFSKSLSIGIDRNEKIIFDNSGYLYAGGIFPVKTYGVFGISVTSFDFSYYSWSDEDGNVLGTTKQKDYSISLSYARQLSENLSFGGSLKYISMELSGLSYFGSVDHKANSVALDFGLLYRNILPESTFSNEFTPLKLLARMKPERLSKGLSFGLTLQNMGNKMTFVDDAQADPIPTNLTLGLAYTPIDLGSFIRVTCALDISKFLIHKSMSEADSSWTSDPWYKAVFTSWDDPKFDETMLGMEIDLLNLIALRAGKHKQDYGLDYSTYGIRIGPEFASINIYKRKHESDYLRKSRLEDTTWYSFGINLGDILWREN